jgi:hypothetical protein
MSGVYHTVWEVQGLRYRCTIENEDKGPSNMTQRTDGDHDPNDNSISTFGGSRNETQITQTKRRLESGNTDLVERTSCIVKLFVASY